MYKNEQVYPAYLVTYQSVRSSGGRGRKRAALGPTTATSRAAARSAARSSKPLVKRARTASPAAALTIRMKAQNGEETYFKVKLSTSIRKVFSAYAQRKGVPVASLGFSIGGKPVAGDETVFTLGLKDQDCITSWGL